MTAPTRRPFTLIELLTVITIIFMLVGMLVGVSAVVRRNANEASTRARLEAMMIALQEHLQDRGYHLQLTGAEAVDGVELNIPVDQFRHTQTGRVYLEDFSGGLYLDAWDRPFRYQIIPGEGYRLWSRGADGGTAGNGAPADDICSWKQR